MIRISVLMTALLLCCTPSYSQQGWTAGAIIGTEGVYADIDAKGASESKAIDLLKETVKRRAAASAK